MASDYQQVVDDIRARLLEQVASMDTCKSEEMKQAGGIRCTLPIPHWAIDRFDSAVERAGGDR